MNDDRNARTNTGDEYLTKAELAIRLKVTTRTIDSWMSKRISLSIPNRLRTLSSEAVCNAPFALFGIGHQVEGHRRLHDRSLVYFDIAEEEHSLNK